jgi:hypothetical protein
MKMGDRSRLVFGVLVLVFMVILSFKRRRCTACTEAPASSSRCAARSCLTWRVLSFTHTL